MTTEITLATTESLAETDVMQNTPEHLAEDAGSILMSQISDNTVEPQPDGTYLTTTEDGTKVIWAEEVEGWDSRGFLAVAE